jgi:hypothetical protein
MRELENGRLRFTTRAADALPEALIVSSASARPTAPTANLVATEQVEMTVARHGPDGVVVVEKSTVPAGTVEWVRMPLAREGDGLRFDVASNPELLRGGSALLDVLEPDRVVGGAESGQARAALQHLTRHSQGQATASAKEELPDLEIAGDPYPAATDRPRRPRNRVEFRHVDLAALRESMTYPVVVGTRNVIGSDEAMAAGLSNYPAGRSSVLMDPSIKREDPDPVPREPRVGSG